MKKQSIRSRFHGFDQYRASKTALLWACAGSAILAMVVGFSWGGWVTGGSAQAMADKAAAQARQELAAVVCVDRFITAKDAAPQLIALQELSSSYAQSRFVQDGGWAVLGDDSTDDRRAAGLCATELAKREILTSSDSAETTAVQ